MRINLPINYNNPYGAPNTAYRLGYHAGADLVCSSGTKLPAYLSGFARYVSGENGGYGNVGTITLVNGDVLFYAHLSGVIKTGNVNEGELCFISGNTGWSTGPHLHLEVRIGGGQDKPTDPIKYLERSSMASDSVIDKVFKMGLYRPAEGEAYSTYRPLPDSRVVEDVYLSAERRTKLSEMGITNDNVPARINSLYADTVKLKGENSTLTNKLNSLTSQNKDLSDTIIELNKQIETLQNQITEFNKKIEVEPPKTEPKDTTNNRFVDWLQKLWSIIFRKGK